MKKKFLFSLLLILVFLISNFAFFDQRNNKSDNSTNLQRDDDFEELSSPKFNLAPWQTFLTSSGVYSVSISADGYYIAFGFGSYLQLFNRSSTIPMINYSLGGTVQAVAISSDGNYVVAGTSINNRISLFNKTSNTPLWNFTASRRIYHVAISSNGSYVAAASDDKNIYFFNKSFSSSKTPMWNYTAYDRFNSVAMSDDGYYIVAGSSDKNIYFFNRTSSRPMWNYSADDDMSWVDISSNGSYTVGGSWDYHAYLFNSTNIENPHICNYSLTGWVIQISISADGKYIAVGTGTGVNGRIYLLNGTGSQLQWNYFVTTPEVISVEISKDGNYIIGGCDDGSIYFFNRTSSTPLWNYTASNYVRWVDISYSGNFSIVGTDNPNLYVFYISSPMSFSLECDAENPDIDGKFKLSWNVSRCADNYSIYHYNRTITEINGSVDLIQEEITNLNHDITVGSGEHYYKVVAFNEFGNASSNCVYVNVTIPPGSFNLSTDASYPDKIGDFNLTWTESAGADNYSVYESSIFISEINETVKLVEDGIKILNRTFSGLRRGRYYYIVVAYNETGSTLSNCINVTVQVPPRNFTLSSNAGTPDDDGKFILYWESFGDADNYSIYYQTTEFTKKGIESILIAKNVTGNSYPLERFIEQDYYFLIIAFNQYGNCTSNCIKITVELSRDGVEDSGKPDNLLWIIIILIGAIMGVSLIGFALQRRSKEKIREKEAELEVFKRQRAEITEDDILISKEKHFCLVHKGPVEGYTFICPKCSAYYCMKCVEAIKEIENQCWSCGNPLDPSKPMLKLQEKEQIKAITEDESSVEDVMHKKPKDVPKSIQKEENENQPKKGDKS